ncbi:MAG: hypothetical protein AAFP84_16930, partial [Actinomycetota bacterium]
PGRVAGGGAGGAVTTGPATVVAAPAAATVGSVAATGDREVAAGARVLVTIVSVDADQTAGPNPTVP